MSHNAVHYPTIFLAFTLAAKSLYENETCTSCGPLLVNTCLYRISAQHQARLELCDFDCDGVCTTVFEDEKESENPLKINTKETERGDGERQRKVRVKA